MNSKNQNQPPLQQYDEAEKPLRTWFVKSNRMSAMHGNSREVNAMTSQQPPPTLHQALAARGYHAINREGLRGYQRAILDGDGVEVFKGTANDVWAWLPTVSPSPQTLQPQSPR